MFNLSNCCRKFGLSAEPIYGHAHGEPAPDVEVADPNFPTGEEAKQQLLSVQHAENRVAAIMLESGVVFHSIFIGIDLGINNDASVVRPLMIALMFHQVSLELKELHSMMRILLLQKSSLCYERWTCWAGHSFSVEEAATQSLSMTAVSYPRNARPPSH